MTEKPAGKFSREFAHLQCDTCGGRDYGGCDWCAVEHEFLDCRAGESCAYPDCDSGKYRVIEGPRELPKLVVGEVYRFKTAEGGACGELESMTIGKFRTHLCMRCLETDIAHHFSKDHLTELVRLTHNREGDHAEK